MAYHNKGQLGCEDGVNKLNYFEFPTSSLLRPFVQCYWMMRLTYSGASPSSHQVLPDGCMDIIFDLRGEGVEVIGTMTRAIEIESASGLDLCGIRFKPGGIYPFTRIDASEFTDNSAPANDVLDSWIHMTLDELAACQTDQKRADYLDFLLENRLVGCDQMDFHFLKFLSDISEDNRFVSKVEQVLPMIGMSQRTLERHFQREVGISAKKYLSIFRLRRLLGEFGKLESSIEWTNLALRHGYHDQAHFIHEFKGITGTTPTHFLLRDPTLSNFYNTNSRSKC